MKLLTPAAVRELDRRAIDEWGIPEAVLMENAASAALRVLEKEPCFHAGPGVILCGGGNNGGDGLALARQLHSRGRPLRVLLFAKAEKLTGAAALNLTILRNLKIELCLQPDEALCREALDGAGYLVDALIGTGLNRPVAGEKARLIRRMNASGKPVLALDIPSGVRGEDGAVLSEAVQAAACVSFGAPKRGNYLYPGYARQGKLYSSRISFPPEEYDHKRYRSEINLPPPLPPRDPEGYKNSFGKILLIAGGGSYYGAPALAASALYRSGCGYVTAALPAPLCPTVSTLCPEIVAAPQKTAPEPYLQPANAEELLALAEKHHGVVLGPGVGRRPETQELIRQLIPEISVPLLIDADALTALAGHPELSRKRRAATILTPHKGEQRTLLQGNKEGETIEELYQALTLYKGPHSAVRTPDGREYLNPTGNAGMGTAGAGDVLTGAVMGLIPRLDPEQALRTGVLLHGLAGDLARDAKGEDGMVASDIAACLPEALRLYRKNHRSWEKTCYNTLHTLA